MSLSGASVLLLEDEFLIAMDAERILQEMGVSRVEIAATMAEAERAADETEFDLAVLDVNINGEMSLPLAERLRQRGVPVVLASGYELQRRELPDKAVCVSKPYTEEALKAAISAAVSGE
jgi:DNA-binding response OmpR family regulator